MAKEKGNIKETADTTKLAEQLSNWKTIIGFMLFIGMGIGNYMVTNYRVNQQEQDLVKLEERVKKTENINYELLLKQLEEIQKANTELTKKIEKTNERVDKVLEILIRK